MLAIAIGLTALVIAHLATLRIPERAAVRQEEDQADGSDIGVDIAGTVRVIAAVPGLFALLLYQTFNNFLGGVFMALLDPYGLSLVSVEVWGALVGFLSFGVIAGGLLVAKLGLGESPLRMVFLVNIGMWTVCIFFAIRASIVLLTVGMATWLCLVPVVEAAEQTILQKVIPPERQGRVFGFAQSIEQAAAPVTAFLIGPIAQLIFIPFMTTGAGVDLLGGWFGTGADRGIALVFTVAGLIGLAVTLLTMRTRSYRNLSKRYQEQSPEMVLSA
jgi:DHA3 family multidrug efflux protein-like MFS transporter